MRNILIILISKELEKNGAIYQEDSFQHNKLITLVLRLEGVIIHFKFIL